LGFQNPASNDTHELLLVLVSRTFQHRLPAINPRRKKTCGLKPRRLCGVLSDLPKVLQKGKRKIAVAQLRGKTTSDGDKTGHTVTIVCQDGFVKKVSSGLDSSGGR
jgi:hypothetical protein